MAAETSWVNHCFDNSANETVEYESFSEINDETEKEAAAAVSLDLILPDDLLERILAYLPIASIFRAGCVCRRWHEIVTSERFLWNTSHVASQKPWYFMFTSSDEPVGYAYDPILRKWYGIDLPCIQTSNWFIASSLDLSIHVYDSEAMTWATTLTEILTGWRAGDESVICDGVLYFLIYSTGGGGPDNRHGLIMYNLRSRSPHGLLMRSFIPAPCSLTCGRLMNLKEKLIMVGGIGKQDRPDIIKGIGIWLLNGREWQEIARMPHKFFQGFGEFDDVFASSGTDDLIYIQSYGAPTLLIFDVNQKQWKWSQKCPVTKRFPLQLFTGFCFEPRLEVGP
ncbi:F-box/kelch-repeat protein [Sesamum angolense]|uniref:F-box/kelch-repeat protein n=1 Tax=Sesamum angolense TaxID=2727404 RepID=A0AAE1T865_9LAMI|nr:F-box/kelch-repeat protein [Sesamum angolense]